MECPAQALDLNPIEILWEHFDCMVIKKYLSNQSNLKASL